MTKIRAMKIESKTKEKVVELTFMDGKTNLPESMGITMARATELGDPLSDILDKNYSDASQGIKDLQKVSKTNTEFVYLTWMYGLNYGRHSVIKLLPNEIIVMIQAHQTTMGKSKEGKLSYNN